MNLQLAIIGSLTLLPWAAVWLGMYGFRQVIWTFFLYHGICLVPAVIAYRHLWLPDLLRPTAKQLLSIATGGILLCVFAFLMSRQQETELLMRHM